MTKILVRREHKEYMSEASDDKDFTGHGDCCTCPHRSTCYDERYQEPCPRERSEIARWEAKLDEEREK